MRLSNRTISAWVQRNEGLKRLKHFFPSSYRFRNFLSRFSDTLNGLSHLENRLSHLENRLSHLHDCLVTSGGCRLIATHRIIEGTKRRDQ